MTRDNFWQRLIIYMRPCDSRYEELKKGTIARNVVDDISAGLILACMSIPLAMGFAMASGLRPEQGIAGGAVAALFGAVFGGSKYLVYGPTAAFIPVIAGLMVTYDHGFLVLASLAAGVMLLVSGFLRLGRIFEKVPHSIVVGFTVGVALIIVFSQVANVLGLKENPGYTITDQFIFLFKNTGSAKVAAILMTVITLVFLQSI
ncbi:MAG: SulP family inorganic anion transporter [Bacteroidota bacterium]